MLTAGIRRALLAPSYTAEAKTLFAAMTAQPSASRKRAVNAAIAALKVAGIWTKLDALYVFAAHASQAALLNWKNPGTWTCSEVSSPTFTVDRGYAGNGTTSYLSTGVAPNGLTKLTQNDAHIGAYVVTEGNGAALIGRSTSTPPVLLQGKATGSMSGRLNSTTASSDAVATANGHSILTRSSSTTTRALKNGVALADTSSTSAARDSATLLIGRASSLFSTDTIGAAHFGGGLTDAEVAIFNSILRTYMRAVGAVSQTSAVVFGDSIAAGGNASATAKRWFNLVTIATTGEALPLNQGISGTVLQNSNDSGGSPMVNNGRDRYVAALLGANKCDKVYIAYGFNDARYTAAPSTFNVTNYQNDLDEVIAGLIAGGYAASDITIVSPYWMSATGLISGSAGFTGQTRAGFEAFVTASAAIAANYHTKYVDGYAAIRDNGGSSLIDTDNIHPIDAGHAVIATAVLAPVQL